MSALDLSKIRVRGRHFDTAGEAWSLGRLMELGGFFQFSDVKERLGQPAFRLRRFIAQTTFPEGVVYRMRLSQKAKGKSTVYLDLPAFVGLLQERFSQR